MDEYHYSKPYQSYLIHFQLKNRNPLEDFEYEISYSTYDSEYPQSNYFEITFSFIFDNEGYLKEATYFSEEFSYSYINDGYESLNQIELNFSSIKGALKEPETLPIDFEDYLLQDIEIVLTDSQGNPLNTNQIEAGAFIYVQTKNPVPETALDIEFEIVKSSNEEVIAQEYSNWSALKEGTTTLTLMNQSGFTKTIDVQVIAPPLSMILVMLENEDKLYPGNTYELSIMRIPSESTDLFEVSVENSTLATIEKIDDLTYDLVCLGIGTTSFFVEIIKNPDINKLFEIEIKEEPQPLPTDELIQALCQASCENYSYTIQFNEDYTGSITDNYYYDTANFTWSINETTITVSAFSLSYYDYTYNTATISEDGLTLTLNFSDDDGYSSISPLLLDSLYQKSISNSVCFFITFYPNAKSNTSINTKPNIIPHVPK